MTTISEIHFCSGTVQIRITPNINNNQILKRLEELSIDSLRIRAVCGGSKEKSQRPCLFGSNWTATFTVSLSRFWLGKRENKGSADSLFLPIQHLVNEKGLPPVATAFINQASIGYSVRKVPTQTHSGPAVVARCLPNCVTTGKLIKSITGLPIDLVLTRLFFCILHFSSAVLIKVERLFAAMVDSGTVAPVTTSWLLSGVY